MVNWTIWISLAFYASAIAVQFLVEDPANRQKTFKNLWRCGCLFAIVHVICAFHFVHHWSHQAAVLQTIEETKAVTGMSFEYGIYFNYLFLLVWAIDCTSGATHSWWTAIVHCYMLLIIVSATIIFESGSIRYISLLGLASLIYLLLRSHSKTAR